MKLIIFVYGTPGAITDYFDQTHEEQRLTVGFFESDHIGQMLRDQAHDDSKTELARALEVAVGAAEDLSESDTSVIQTDFAGILNNPQDDVFVIPNLIHSVPRLEQWIDWYKSVDPTVLFEVVGIDILVCKNPEAIRNMHRYAITNGIGMTSILSEKTCDAVTQIAESLIKNV